MDHARGLAMSSAELRTRTLVLIHSLRVFTLPGVAQLAQFQEHRLRFRMLPQVRELLAQPCDDPRILQSEEGVDALFLSQRGDRRRRILATATRCRQQL